MITFAKNSFATRKNYIKYVKYLEHNNKNDELIIKSDSWKNIQLVDNEKLFKKALTKWEKDMFFRNFNKKKNLKRDVKTKNELNSFLDKKNIITTYRVSENSLFFAKFFKNDPKKIKNYYENVLFSIKNEFSLSDEQIVDATIHFDQTSPHLHLAISNLYIKYNKEFEKNFYSVNTRKFNLIELMRKEYSGRKNYEKINLSFAKNLKDYGYLYQDPKNRLYVSKLRGFEANKLIDFSIQNTSQKIKINEWIYNYQIKGLKYKLEKFQTTKDYKNPVLRANFLRKNEFLKKKYFHQLNYNNARNESSYKDLEPYQKNALQKKLYFDRMNIDLASLGLLQKYNENNFNQIEKSREYNKILELCEYKNIENELKFNQNFTTTPQTIASELYNKDYSFLDKALLEKNGITINPYVNLIEKQILNQVEISKNFDDLINQLKWIESKNNKLTGKDFKISNKMQEKNAYIAFNISKNFNLIDKDDQINSKHIKSLGVNINLIDRMNTKNKINEISKNNTRKNQNLTSILTQEIFKTPPIQKVNVNEIAKAFDTIQNESNIQEIAKAFHIEESLLQNLYNNKKNQQKTYEDIENDISK